MPKIGMMEMKGVNFKHSCWDADDVEYGYTWKYKKLLDVINIVSFNISHGNLNSSKVVAK